MGYSTKPFTSHRGVGVLARAGAGRCHMAEVATIIAPIPTPCRQGVIKGEGNVMNWPKTTNNKAGL